MATHSTTLPWKITWVEEPGRLQSMGSPRVGHDWVTSLSLFQFHALEKEMATHSNVLSWRIPGTGEPGGLLSMGLHRVGHNLAAAAAASPGCSWPALTMACLFKPVYLPPFLRFLSVGLVEGASLSGGYDDCDVELGRWPYLFLSARRKLGCVKNCTPGLASPVFSPSATPLLNLLHWNFSFLMVSYAYLEFLEILLTLFYNFSRTFKISPIVF